MKRISKLFEFLEQWIIRYVNNRNLVLNNVEKISKGNESEGFVDVKYKDKEHRYFLVGFIDDNILKKIKEEIQKDRHCSIILLNTRINLDFVVKNWNELIKNRKLSIIFINPFSKTDRIWSVFPQTHDFISEGKAIKAGLNALFSNVEESTEQEFRKIIES